MEKERIIVSENNEEKVSAKKALEVTENNMDVLDLAIGKVKVSKRLYQICCAVGVVSTGIGAVGLVLSGPIAPVAIAIGFGTTSAVYSGVMAKKETNKEAMLCEDYNKNLDSYEAVLAKTK